MKNKDINYQQALIRAVESKSNVKNVARNFWRLLAKNNQLKNLRQIVDNLEEEYAREKGIVYFKVYSDHLLEDKQLSEISQLLERKLKSRVYLKNIIKPGKIEGIKIKNRHYLYDLTFNNKLINLKKALISKE